MRRNLTIGMLACAVIALAAVDGGAAEPDYYADLEPVERVVGSKAKGQAKFWLSANGKRLRYEVTVENAELVRGAHVHLGKDARTLEGEHTHLPMEEGEGPVVFFLLDFQPTGINVEGVLAEGEIMARDLTGPLKGEPLSSLIDHFNKGWAYVNVHVTQQFESGKVFCCPAGVRGTVWFR